MARSLPAQAALAARCDERADDVGSVCRPGDRQRREVAERSGGALPEQPCAAGCVPAGGVPYGYRDTQVWRFWVLKWERVQEREQPVPKTHRVQLIGDQLPVANRGVDAGERDSLFVERNPDLLYVCDQLMIKEVWNGTALTWKRPPLKLRVSSTAISPRPFGVIHFSW